MSAYYKQTLVKLPWFGCMALQAIVVRFILVHIGLLLGLCLPTAFLPVRMLDKYDCYIVSYSTSHLKPELSSGDVSELKRVWKDLDSWPWALKMLYIILRMLYSEKMHH